MNARRRRSSLLLLLVLGLAAGCRMALPPPRQPIPEDARRAVELLRSRWQAVTDQRALADIVVHRGDQRQNLTGVLLAKAPASLRFEALSPFGQPMLLAVIHDGRLTTYSVLNNEALVGEATADTTSRLLGLPFEAQDLVAVVSGHAVPPSDLRMGEILPPDDAGPSLSLVGQFNEQRVWMDFATGVVRQLQIVGGRAAATVTYRRDDEGRLTGLDITAAQRYVTGTVRYRSLATGVGLTGEQFALTLPKDAKTQPIR